MDDAQQIMLVALQQAGVNVPAEAKGVHELGPNALVVICEQAVALMRGSSTSPTSGLPSGTAERFRVCMDLALDIKQLGYQGDLSFHQFLYPSHSNTHRLLRFLLDRLSRSSTPSSRGRKGHAAPTLDKLSATVQHALVHSHASAHTSAKDKGDVGVPFRTCSLRLSTSRAVEGEVQKKPTLVTLQAKPRAWLLPALLELNVKNAVTTKGLEDAELAQLAQQVKQVSKSRDTKVISKGVLLLDKGPGTAGASSSALEISHLLGQEESWGAAAVAQVGDGQHQAKTHTLVNAQLQEQLASLIAQADKMEAEARDKEQRGLVLKERHEGGLDRIQEMEKKSLLMRTAVNLALHPTTPPTSAQQQLQSRVTASEQHLAALQAEWDAVRQPLEEKKADLEKIALSGRGELHGKLRQIKEMRQQMKPLSTLLRVREEEIWTIRAEVEREGNVAKRSSYVHRITELVRNSQKQATDIARIILDTRHLQRDSNAAHDRLRRTHALVDELVFRDAKRDTVCRQAYRSLSTIHETFADIVDRVFEMDKIGREIAELQAMLEDLQKSPVDITSVQSDLDAIMAENHILEKGLAEVLDLQQGLADM